MQFIDLQTQYQKYRAEIDGAMREVLEKGQYILGPQVAELERGLAAFSGARHCTAVANGTEAILIALLALDIRPGDEVITTPFTFFATAEMPALLGIKPVFVDIEADSFNIDPKAIEAAITPRTRAVIPVSLFGQLPDTAAIQAVARRHGIAIIEDAAQSFGATAPGVHSCSWADVSTTSFYPAKPLGCYGDGGAIFAENDALAEKIRLFYNHGQGKERFLHMVNGVNGRLDTLQAAVLLVKLKYFAGEIALRQRVAETYATGIRERGIRATVPYTRPNYVSTWAQYTIRVANRPAVQSSLQASGIPTGVYYPVPMHEQPALEKFGYKRGMFPVAEAAAAEVLALPMHPWLEKPEQDKILDALRIAAGPA